VLQPSAAFKGVDLLARIAECCRVGAALVVSVSGLAWGQSGLALRKSKGQPCSGRTGHGRSFADACTDAPHDRSTAGRTHARQQRLASLPAGRFERRPWTPWLVVTWCVIDQVPEAQRRVPSRTPVSTDDNLGGSQQYIAGADPVTSGWLGFRRGLVQNTGLSGGGVAYRAGTRDPRVLGQQRAASSPSGRAGRQGPLLDGEVRQLVLGRAARSAEASLFATHQGLLGDLLADAQR